LSEIPENLNHVTLKKTFPTSATFRGSSSTKNTFQEPDLGMWYKAKEVISLRRNIAELGTLIDEGEAWTKGKLEKTLVHDRCRKGEP
jgi:hypothetical protein